MHTDKDELPEDGSWMYPEDEYQRVSTHPPMSVPQHIRDFIDKKLKEHHPSDLVEVDDRTRRVLDNLMVSIYPDTLIRTGDMYRAWSPSDMLFSDKIPLEDCILDVHDDTTLDESVEWVYRVLIFGRNESVPLYSDNIKNILLRGAAVLFQRNARIIYPIFIRKEEDSILYVGSYMYGASGFADRTWQEDQGCFHVLSFAWYGVQAALLHPKVQDVLAKAKPQRTETPDMSGKHKKNKPVRYVKRHVLNEDVAKIIEGETCGAGKNHEMCRKTMSWYVIGHERHYKKSGKTIWIDPYWKGPLRDTRKAIKPRKREIVTE